MKLVMFLLGLWVAIIVYEIHTFEQPHEIGAESGIEQWKLADAIPDFENNVCRFPARP